MPRSNVKVTFKEKMAVPGTCLFHKHILFRLAADHFYLEPERERETSRERRAERLHRAGSICLYQNDTFSPMHQTLDIDQTLFSYPFYWGICKLVSGR